MEELQTHRSQLQTETSNLQTQLDTALHEREQLNTTKVSITICLSFLINNKNILLYKNKTSFLCQSRSYSLFVVGIYLNYSLTILDCMTFSR